AAQPNPSVASMTATITSALEAGIGRLCRQRSNITANFCRRDSIAAQRLTAIATAQGTPSVDIDAVRDEVSRTVGKQEIDATRVHASGWLPGVLELDAVPLRRVWRIVMIILRVLRLSVRPAGAAIGLPGRKGSANLLGDVGVSALLPVDVANVHQGRVGDVETAKSQ